jgi:Transposase domain (DUF772)
MRCSASWHERLHLAYRWFCRLALDDKVPHHSTFSVNRHGRFRDSDIFRELFEAVVRACMVAGHVKGEGFAIDASVMEADASRYHGKAPDEIDWSGPERQTRAVAEFLSGLDNEDPDADRKPPKVTSPTDLSLPKSRFERTDDVARQGSDPQQRLRTARSGVCRACPSRAKHAFAPRYNRWHISKGFGEGAPR